ncbi:MAG TPA: PEP-CTERM sorting domain-containing protein, partial [Tepidisphaeraceae bacterium]|nr:PEP-CTERM sorting domain-containing protein [Tepidisphaeraceae bacterium]
FGGSPDHLFRIDPNTALSTPIGAGIGFDNVFALGFSQAGKLYGISNTSHQLLLIDTTLGTGGAVGPVAQLSVFDLATRPEDGAAFIVDSGTNSLYRIDLNTGGTGLIGAHLAPHNMVGLAFGPAVPEPATFALLAIGAAIATLRRRR